MVHVEARRVRPRILDLFSGAGGAAVGYHRAGFDVVGVDIEPQPNYPFEFKQKEAIHFLESGDWEYLGPFDAIHASPPCQGYTTMGQRYPATQEAHPRLIADVRDLIDQTGLPYVIENVVGARKHLYMPVQVCSRAFGLGVARHRLYESSVQMMVSQCRCDGSEIGVYGKLDGRRLWTRRDGSELRAARTLEQASEAMGIDWMTWDELREAIPPAHTEHIGYYLRQHLDYAARGSDNDLQGARLRSAHPQP